MEEHGCHGDAPGAPVCDFCSSTKVTCGYEAGDFDVAVNPAITWTSLSWWAACADCEAFVDANDQKGLSQWAWSVYIHDHPIMRNLSADQQQVLKARMSEAHKKFFQSKRKKMEELPGSETVDD